MASVQMQMGIPNQRQTRMEQRNRRTSGTIWDRLEVVDQRESKKAKGNTARRGDPSCAPFVQTEQLDTDHDSFSSKYALKMDSVWRCVSEMTP